MKKSMHRCGQGCGHSCNNGPAKYILPAILVSGGLALLILNGCHVKRPRNLEVVQDFDIEKYAGKWYEIARFDFKHEKHLSHVTANYSLNADGSVKVENKGYNYVKKEWETATGVAKFNGDKSEGALKVSFFRPFYSGYNVVLMDPDYENALVFGENKRYIWFLSRNKAMPQATKQKFMDKAREYGYDMKKLVWTKQD